MISLTNAAFIAPVSSLAAQYVPPKETRVLYCAQVHECTCSSSMVSRYQKRISVPLLDRLVEARFRILRQPHIGQGC